MAEQTETITFELIRKIQREEQRTPKLTKLPESFYKNVKSYLENKRTASNRRVALEAKNAERLVEDIFNRRERKLFNLSIITARTGIAPENLTEEEKVFFESIVDKMKERRAKIIDKILEKAAGKKETETLVVFSEDVPEFVGSDMKTYGPFKKGDISKLPKENMKVMINRGVAKEFKVEK
jgi:DNA replication initiation complex subunit (GINS family)